MRKIEKQMVAAIHAKDDWKLANTSVSTDGATTEVRLHGNLIASFDWENMVMHLTHAGWPTRTTHSRLNAILSVFSTTKGVRYEGEPTTYLIRA